MLIFGVPEAVNSGKLLNKKEIVIKMLNQGSAFLKCLPVKCERGMAEKLDVPMNTFPEVTDAAYIYAEGANLNQVKISIDDIFNIALNKVNTLINTTYNTPILIAEGVGFLIIQESWKRIDVSVFFVSLNRIRAIIDDYNSINKLSVVGEKVYWTETVPSYNSVRKWFWGLNGKFASY